MTAHLTTPRVAALALVAAFLIAGCSAETTAPPSSESSVLATDAVADTVAALPQESLAPVPPARLAHGLLPPTNRWFSGLVFGDAPEPVFPLPLAFSLTGDGFDFGVPAVSTSADTISTGPSSDVSVSVAGATSSRVSAYDDASVTIELLDGSGDPIGSAVIAEGSPVVSFTAERDAEVTLSTDPEATGSGQLYTTGSGDRRYGMTTEGSVQGGDVTLASGGSVVWFAVPAGSSAADLAGSARPVTGVDLSYSIDDRVAVTTLDYSVSGPGDTLIAVLPHQRDSRSAPAASACNLGAYETVYGTMQLCSGRELSWSAPLIEPSATLPLDGVDDATAAAIRTQLAADVQQPAELPADTYFGGKALYRLANLLQLAKGLGDEASATIVRQRLGDALLDWTTVDRCESQTTSCFVYDPDARGLVGKVAAFGSDQFNDHHFHYGYLLYAASVAVQDDPSLAARITPVMDVVAADIATDGASALFPERRVFDAFAGHSWASGYSPFRDGNNQESSSEAVAAWNGLALWGDASSDTGLSTEARWMLANEAATALAYWTDFDTAEPVYDGYAHSVVALNWGAKRDYSTWFSAEPNAKLGIQLIPMTPASGYLGTDPDRVARNLAEATVDAGPQFGDYLLMYSALAGAGAATTALRQAADLPDASIDDADARSYLMAFIASRARG